MRILVVDDDRAVRESLRRSLQFNGYTVELAENGQQAMDAVARQRPDAMVLDMMMPRVDGLEVCRRLRSTGDDFPVLVLTARDAVSDRVVGLDAGADDYLPKPFALEELLARLRALLRRSTPSDSAGSGGVGGELVFADLGLDPGTRAVEWLAGSSQRRQLTVMFCDVVGATHLSGNRDVEAYFLILHAYHEVCRPVVERFGGLIAQRLGDGIYVWFGYPVPKGDEAIRAVRAGLDLLVVIRRLSASLESEIGEPLAVRIAVHAGEALVASIADEPLPLAFGHTPNLAAKLQQAALPGTLVISGDILRMVKDSFEVEVREPVVLAGGSIVQIYEVIEERYLVS